MTFKMPLCIQKTLDGLAGKVKNVSQLTTLLGNTCLEGNLFLFNQMRVKKQYLLLPPRKLLGDSLTVTLNGEIQSVLTDQFL